MRAIESPSTLDDQQWLTYWVLYSLITLFELSCWKVLQWYATHSLIPAEIKSTTWSGY